MYVLLLSLTISLLQRLIESVVQVKRLFLTPGLLPQEEESKERLPVVIVT
jgi:hypothetical protein